MIIRNRPPKAADIIPGALAKERERLPFLTIETVRHCAQCERQIVLEARANAWKYFQKRHKPAFGPGSYAYEALRNVYVARLHEALERLYCEELGRRAPELLAAFPGEYGVDSQAAADHLASLRGGQ